MLFSQFTFLELPMTTFMCMQQLKIMRRRQLAKFGFTSEKILKHTLFWDHIFEIRNTLSAKAKAILQRWVRFFKGRSVFRKVGQLLEKWSYPQIMVGIRTSRAAPVLKAFWTLVLVCLSEKISIHF